MSSGLSYAAALGQGKTDATTSNHTTSHPEQTRREQAFTRPVASQLRKRSISPSHIPRTTSAQETVYVLSLKTDKAHHDRMTDLRGKYFPKNLNKLAAHLTLFHALPASQMESSIIPALTDITCKTASFPVHATDPFRMKKGFAINVSGSQGGREAKDIHRALQRLWKDFLNEQDAGACRVHYTLMNKVDDEKEVQRAFDEFSRQWKGDRGTAEGLALWRYDRGFWRFEREFAFEAAP